MIERHFVAQKLKEFMVKEFITSTLKRIGHSKTTIQRTPLGEKITIFASSPGLVVGRKGQNIRMLTEELKKKFEFDNPQIETVEVTEKNLDAAIVAEMIASTLEKFGSQRFKAIGHKTMSDILRAGALGVEIIMSGKIPGARAKNWRFYQGYLKKCGEFARSGVRTAYAVAQLKSGSIGIRVKIMPSDLKLPDHIEVLDEPIIIEEETDIKETETKKKKVTTKPKKKKTTTKKPKVKAKKPAKKDKE